MPKMARTPSPRVLGRNLSVSARVQNSREEEGILEPEDYFYRDRLEFQARIVLNSRLPSQNHFQIHRIEGVDFGVKTA